MITRAGFWAMESESRPVNVTDFEHEAEWDREHCAWEFDDGSRGQFTKRPVLKDVGAEHHISHYRFEALPK